MQVRRKTPILEARQFTAESAMELIRDGWLKATVSSADGTVGKLTASASRDSGVQLGEWIVLESHLELVDADDVLKVLNRVPRFRAYSAEQFSQDFEVVDDTAKRADWNGTHDIHGVVDVLVPEGFEVVPPEEMDAMVKASKAARPAQG